MLFIEEISVTKIKSMSKEKADYASHIPADRLIHIMRFAREMEQTEWDVFDSYISGESLDAISLRLKVPKTTVHRKLRKITEKMERSVLG